MLQKELSNVVLHNKEILIKNNEGGQKIFQNLSDAEKAGLMKVNVESFKTPLILTPSRLKEGQRSLTINNSVTVDPTIATTGRAVFTSMFLGIINPGAKVLFPQITGKKHLVEFNVELFEDKTYLFRIMTSPGDTIQDISVEGPKLTILHALVQADDNSNLQQVASIMQFNTENDAASWALYSVLITATS